MAQPPSPTAEPPSAQVDGEPETDSADGVAWVAGGRLHVRNPRGLGRWPSVLADPQDGVHLSINGTPATGEVVVRTEDDVQVRATAGETEGALEVSVAEDLLSAWILLRAPAFTTVALPDVAPANQIRLSAFARQETRPHGLGAEDVGRALAGAGVRAGINEAAVRQALERTEQRTLVACGQAPQPGVPARLWSVLHGWVERPVGSCPPSAARAAVKIGEPVALLVPATQGQPGLTVTGEVLPAPVVWQAELAPGHGVLCSADGQTAIAALAGRPHVRVGERLISCEVRPEREVAGDVDESMGLVAQDGDIWVAGSVQAGSHVRASGDVEVHGRVLRARLHAGADLEVRGGAAYAVLAAGGAGLLYAQVLPLCERIERMLRRRATGGSVPLRELASLVAKIEGLCGEAESPLEEALIALRPALVALGAWATGDAPPRNEAAVLAGAEAALASGLAAMRPALARPGRCAVSHLDHSRIEASGDVEIGEAGALRSHVVTLGQLTVHGPFRGGSVLALGGATFLGLGPAGDAPVRVQLGERAAFRAGEVFPGTVVMRGALVRRFEAPERHVIWAIDGEGSEVAEDGTAGAGELAPGTPAPGAPARRG